MALGAAQVQDRFANPREILGDRLREGSVYRLLADEGHRLFPDDYFADLFTDSVRGRPTIPARVVATVMLLQSFEGLSDREAADRLEVDLRWQAAAGVDTGAEAFHPTLLVGMRNRLRASERPDRLHEDTVVAAKQAGVVRHQVRALDSTPLYDSVATQDTVTQLRAAIRKLLRAAPAALAAAVRAALRRDDDYASLGKPPCDWDDPEARAELVDALVRDALAALEVCDGELLGVDCAQAVRLLALVAGQDVALGDDGRFGIVRGVARDRVISTVDTQARHGHKSHNRRFDGYKTHLSVDPDSEIITSATATPANTPDRDLVDELLEEPELEDESDGDRPVVVGDAAYGDGATRARMADAGRDLMAKLPPVRNSTGGFAKDRFAVDLDAGTVTCPAHNTVPIVFGHSGGRASFGALCGPCPLRASCTSAAGGRQVTIHPQEALLQRARAEQADPDWQARYRAARPVAERKISHYTRRLWGGRKARTRGVERIKTDVATRCGVLNLARLAVLGLRWEPGGWTVTPA